MSKWVVGNKESLINRIHLWQFCYVMYFQTQWNTTFYKKKIKRNPK